MNKKQLEQNVGSRGRLRPPAKGAGGADIDDDWLITKVTDSTVELTHMPTNEQATLGLDHVKERMSDTSRDEPGPRYGFLVLNVHVLQQPDGCFVAEPLVARLGGAAAPAIVQRPAVEQGRGIRKETVEENAARLQREREQATARRQFLTTNAGVDVANRAVQELFERIATLQPVGECHLIRDGSGLQIYRKGYSVRVNWYGRYMNTLDGSQLVITEWDGRPDFGSERYASFDHRPSQLREHTFEFDMDQDGSIGWRGEDGSLRSSAAVAEFAVNLLIELVRAGQGERDDWA